MKFNPLTTEEEYVIINKGTEMPFTGEYFDFHEAGTYHCKHCNAALYKSDAKFNSGCGWPSFDDEIAGAVKRIPDKDGRRTEIVCANCGAHLGHVFLGEGFTDKNTRHCVNSISLTFEPQKDIYDTAFFASGCFWGTQYWFEKTDGVISTRVGYTGGHLNNPTYKEVCTGKTGHVETLEVVFDPTKTSYETLAKLFFETHDQSQEDGQGPDIGEQYRSEIFYTNLEQKAIAEKLIAQLKTEGYGVATIVTKAEKFWEGEDYHQHYYKRKNGTPYCHAYKKKF
jgi:peptide methionine sulfoxide reductase msrA/msrB